MSDLDAYAQGIADRSSGGRSKPSILAKWEGDVVRTQEASKVALSFGAADAFESADHQSL